MKINNINERNDPVRITLGDIIPEPQLTRVCLALKHNNQHGCPNNIIDEGFFGDLLHGGLLNLRSLLTALPPEVRKNQQVNDLLDIAKKSPVTILDPKMNRWWQRLAAIFIPKDKTGKPLDNMAGFSAKVKQAVQTQAQHIIDNNKARQDRAASQDDTQNSYNTMKKELQRQAAIERLLARYGVHPTNLSNPKQDAQAIKTAAKSGMPPEQQETVAANMSQLIKFLNSPQGKEAYQTYQQALNPAKTVNADIARSIIKAITENNDLAAQAIDMLNPQHRAHVGRSFVAGAQNKVIATIAIAAALELKTKLEKQQGAVAATATQPPRKTTTIQKPATNTSVRSQRSSTLMPNNGNSQGDRRKTFMPNR